MWNSSTRTTSNCGALLTGWSWPGSGPRCCVADAVELAHEMLVDGAALSQLAALRQAVAIVGRKAADLSLRRCAHPLALLLQIALQVAQLPRVASGLSLTKPQLSHQVALLVVVERPPPHTAFPVGGSVDQVLRRVQLYWVAWPTAQLLAGPWGDVPRHGDRRAVSVYAERRQRVVVADLTARREEEADVGVKINDTAVTRRQKSSMRYTRGVVARNL